MVREQDTLIQNWTKFYLSIQAGLAVALYYLMSRDSSSALELRIVGNLAIPLLGVVTTIAVTNIIVREHFWQGRYVAQIRKLPQMPEVYKREWVPDEPDPAHRGHNAKQFWWLRNALLVGWSVWGTISIYVIIFGSG
jgi:hypothetical protein